MHTTCKDMWVWRLLSSAHFTMNWRDVCSSSNHIEEPHGNERARTHTHTHKRGYVVSCCYKYLLKRFAHRLNHRMKDGNFLRANIWFTDLKTHTYSYNHANAWPLHECTLGSSSFTSLSLSLSVSPAHLLMVFLSVFPSHCLVESITLSMWVRVLE